MSTDHHSQSHRKKHPRTRRATRDFLLFAAIYAGAAYLFVPALWEFYAHRHPALEDIPDITYTGSGIPGDPLNVALVGTETELKKAMLAADWRPADPLTLKSCLEIAEATVFDRSYVDAPVSNLYFEHRKEDLAFEKPVGDNPKQRNHVRFWKLNGTDPDGRPVWVGSATYDKRVGLSDTTGQVTHHIGADVDVERDRLMADLKAAGKLTSVDTVTGFHKVCQGRNGEGDPWHTDGDLYVGVLAAQ